MQVLGAEVAIAGGRLDHRMAEDSAQVVLEQIAGPKSRAAPKGTQAMLLRDLADFGVKVATTNPQADYARLHHESWSRQALADVNEDDLDEDQADAIDGNMEEAAPWVCLAKALQ